MDSSKRNSRAVLGIILILIGAALIAVNLNWIPFSLSWLVSWKMLLIVIGIVLLASKQNKGPGIVLILIGGFFLALDFVDSSYYLHRIFWPSLIILVGIMFLFRGRRTHLFDAEYQEHSDQDFIDDTNIFGGGQKVVSSKNFQGGKITSVFGGSTIDLTQAQLSKGMNVIDVVSIFGGSKLVVPRDWDIHLEVTAIFGGYSDKRVADPHIVHDPTKKLIVKGVAIFGGGELTYVP
jgi:predicted membrane protein